MRLLAAYRWPGNVRELRSEVHRWTVFCDDHVDVADLAPEIRGAVASAAIPVGAPPAATLDEVVAAAERAAIAAALAAHGGNLLRTAKALAIERNTLKRKLARYQIR
jgi:two-component system response regulator AtoC